MTLPGIQVTKREGSATTATRGANLPVVIGPAKGGALTENTPYIFNKISSLYGTANAGYGFGVDVAGCIVEGENQRSSAVVFIPATTSVAAPTMYVTGSVEGLPSTKVKLEGTPNNDYQFVLDILAGTSLETGITCRYSLDEGFSYTQPFVLQHATLPVTASITNSGTSFVVEADATFTANERFTSVLIPQTMNASDISAAFASLSGSINFIGGTPKAIFVANQPLTDAQGALNAAQINTSVSGLEAHDIRTQTLAVAQKRPVGTTPATKAAEASELFSAFSGIANATGNIISYTVGTTNTLTPGNIPGCVSPRRSFIQACAARFCNVDVNTNPAMKKLGSLPRVVLSNTKAIPSPSWDEYVDGELYSSSTNKFIAPRTYLNDNGVYITQDHTRCATNSTYDSWHRGRVVNLVCDTVQTAQDTLINDQVDVNEGTNTIAALDAANIEGSVNSRLQARILSPKNYDGVGNGKIGYCSTIEYLVDRQHNMSDKTLYSEVKIVPFADVANVVTTVSFERSTTGTTTVTK